MHGPMFSSSKNGFQATVLNETVDIISCVKVPALSPYRSLQVIKPPLLTLRTTLILCLLGFMLIFWQSDYQET